MTGTQDSSGDDDARLLDAVNLTEAIQLWRGDPNRDAAAEQGADEAILTVSTDGGGFAPEVSLTRGQLRELTTLLHDAMGKRRLWVERRKRVGDMATLLVQARRAGRDVGLVLAAAAARAAGPRTGIGGPGGAYALIAGRPGSWEASILWQWAQEGDRDADDPEFVPPLERIMRDMAAGRDDGGDAVSQALGRAATELGSVAALAAGSVYEVQVWKLAGQYAEVDDRWPE